MSDCIEWTRAKSSAGYGQTYRNGKVVYVHRVTWEDANGPIPDGMVICHRCDNPACYNIEHLFIGTVADNNRDMHQKGRGQIPHYSGEHNPAARLTEAQVAVIRTDDRILRKVAADYGVSIDAIHRIRRGKTWKTS